MSYLMGDRVPSTKLQQLARSRNWLKALLGNTHQLNRYTKYMTEDEQLKLHNAMLEIDSMLVCFDESSKTLGLKPKPKKLEFNE